MERVIGFVVASAVFGSILALISAFYPVVFPWVVGVMFAGIIMSAAPLPR